MDIKEKSYIYGLLGTDGNLCLQERNRGRVSLEVNIKDRDIVEKLFSIVPNSSITERTRNTNFKEDYHSIIFRNSQKDFRDELIEFGFPTENKTNNFTIPIQEYSEADFWRGVIDGDGSVSFTSDGFPFVSLVTKSEPLKIAYCDMLLRNFNISKNIQRNKRDGVFNIMVFKEQAQQLCEFLYKDAVISLDRKRSNALKALEWQRPATMRKDSPHKRWDKEQDDYILSHSIEESMEHLGRTKQSIKTRLYRLNVK